MASPFLQTEPAADRQAYIDAQGAKEHWAAAYVVGMENAKRDLYRGLYIGREGLDGYGAPMWAIGWRWHHYLCGVVVRWTSAARRYVT